MYHYLPTVFGLFTLAACAGPSQQATSRQAASAEARVVTLQIVDFSANDQKFLAPGDTVKTGERLALKLTVGAPVYLYVVQTTQRTPYQQLFPVPPLSPEPSQPGTATHLPGPGQYFTLDENLGVEVVYAVASAQPLLPEQVRTAVQTLPCCGTADGSSAPTPSAEVTLRDPPVVVKGRNRDYDFVRHELRKAILPDRPTILRFNYLHQ